jgi:DNA-binding SARP family transcriptional activator
MRGIGITGQDGECIRIDLLGGLKVRAGRTAMGSPDISSAKLRRVLLALLLSDGRLVSRERLISLLWAGSPPRSAKATLESYVCVLRKKLQPFQGKETSLITTAAGCYAIDLSRIDLDLVRYEHLMSAALRPGTSATDALPMLQQAIALGQAPLVPEEPDFPWLDEVRRIHNENVRRNLVAAAIKVAGTPSGFAERWARLALRADPLDESPWQALLVSLEASGQHADGLRAYDRCRRLFAAELGCSPGPVLQELYVRLLRGANENDEELSRLFEAVVRVHKANRLATRTPITAQVGSSGNPIGQTHETGSVDKAYRTLNQLLQGSGSSTRTELLLT